MIEFTITESCYWLATDRVKVAHFGYAFAGQHLITNQPELITFQTMDDLVAEMVACNFPIVDGPTHPEKEWYLWDTMSQADAALEAINSHSAFPVLIPDLATGKHTVSVAAWCSASREMTDGRWGFPRIPEYILNEWNISQENRSTWISLFNPQIVIL